MSVLFIYCCEYGTIKTCLSIKTNTSSESGEISKKRSRRFISNTLKHVLQRKFSQQVVSNSKIGQFGSKSKVKKKLKRLTGISFCAAYTIQEDPASCSNPFPTCELPFLTLAARYFPKIKNNHNNINQNVPFKTFY